MLVLQLSIALLADRVLGEVSRFHPLVGFGNIANSLEARVRATACVVAQDDTGDLQRGNRRERWLGGLCWTLLVLVPSVLLSLLLDELAQWSALSLSLVVLYFCLGGRSLVEHARAVSGPLLAGDLDMARQLLSRIVSRDTAQLDAPAVTAATVESVLENGSDAVLAPLFWFAVAGAPGALAYRLANTLDAMWGYRNDRYFHFGRMAARMDDLLNWVPARCCALGYGLAGQLQSAMRCWRTQAPLCDSPNAGPVMAAGAGALGIVVGGEATYDNEKHWRPQLGVGRAAVPADIERAIALLHRVTVFWLLGIVALELVLWS